MRRDLLIIHDPDADGPKIPRCVLLDKPAPAHPILNALMREAIEGLILTNDGSVASWSRRVTGSRSPVSPTSTLGQLVEALLRAYIASQTHRERIVVIKDAQTALAERKFAPDRSKVRGTLEWKAAIAKDARSLRALARIYGVSHGTVANLKKKL